ncbi:MAG: NosD domain-containing protein [Candidatus Norongarragalinales archaeon]
MGLLRGQAKAFIVLLFAVAGVLLFAFNASGPSSLGQSDGIENWTVTLSASEQGESSFNYTSLPENRMGVLRVIKDSTNEDVLDFESGQTWVYCASCNLSESTYTIFYQTPAPAPSPSPLPSPSPTPKSSPSPEPSPTPFPSPEISPEPSPSPSPSLEPTPIPTKPPSGQCGVITQNTVLDSDVFFNSDGGVCFDIRGNNVQLDCNGHSIMGNGKGIAVYATQAENIAVKNCRITNFGYGILVEGNAGTPAFSGFAVENNFLSGIKSVGIGFRGAFNSVSVSNNTLESTGERGIWIDGLNGFESKGVLVSSNRISACENALLLDAIGGVVASGNFVEKCSNGVTLSSAFKNTVSKNTIGVSNAAFWIESEDANENVFSENSGAAAVAVKRHPRSQNQFNQNSVAAQFNEQEFEETQIEG